MRPSLSAHDILRFRRQHAGWQVSRIFVRGAQLFYVELIELPEDPVPWSIQRAAGRAVLSRCGAHADVPASLMEEVIATHRAAVLTCLGRRLEEGLVDMQGARNRVRKIRAIIAIPKG